MNENDKVVKIGIYQHYKGNKYEVIGVAKDSETLEEFVVYRALYDNKVSKLWIRQVDLFTDKVEVDGETIDRYKYIGE